MEPKIKFQKKTQSKYTAILYKRVDRMMTRTGYGTRINTAKHYENKNSDIGYHKPFFSGAGVFWAPPKLKGPNVVAAVLPPDVAGVVEAAKSPPGFADPKPKSGGGAADPSVVAAVGLLLLV